jgi:hypothetical protein
MAIVDETEISKRNRWRGGRFVAGVPCLVALALLLETCMLLSPPTGRLLFAQGEARCATEGDSDTATISVQQGRVQISGRILTDVPCEHLVPTLTVTSRSIRLSVTTIAKPGACPICLGAIEYRAVITDLPEGTYRLEIRHEERLISEVDVSFMHAP